MAVAGRLLGSQPSPPAEDGQELGTAGLTGSCLSPFASVLCFGFFPLFFRAVIATAEEPGTGEARSCWAAGFLANMVYQPAGSVSPLTTHSRFAVCERPPSALA